MAQMSDRAVSWGSLSVRYGSLIRRSSATDFLCSRVLHQILRHNSAWGIDEGWFGRDQSGFAVHCTLYPVTSEM